MKKKLSVAALALIAGAIYLFTRKKSPPDLDKIIREIAESQIGRPAVMGAGQPWPWGPVDCGEYVVQLIEQISAALGDPYTRSEIGTYAAQICEWSQEIPMADLRSGDLIGIAAPYHSFAYGRYKDIGHIGMIYLAQDGTRMFSHASPSAGEVIAMDLEAWLNLKHSQPATHLYGFRPGYLQKFY